MITIIIPARLESTRLPRKMLKEVNGVPLICRTFFNVDKQLPRFSIDAKAYVATDSVEIIDACNFYSVPWVQTSKASSGTERMWLASTILKNRGYYVNVQGDLPDVDLSALYDFKEVLRRSNYSPLPMFNKPIIGLHYEINPVNSDIANDCNRTKVVKNTVGRVLYYSRLPIPFNNPAHINMGVYCLHKSTLNYLYGSALTLPFQNKSENLEQIYWLENNIDIYSYRSTPCTSIDTLEDLQKYQCACKIPSDFLLHHIDRELDKEIESK